MDLDNGLVTLNVAKMNHPIEPHDIVRVFHFGFITNQGYEDPGYRHDFTTDMVGRAIYWTYKEGMPRIKHSGLGSDESCGLCQDTRRRLYFLFSRVETERRSGFLPDGSLSDA